MAFWDQLKTKTQTMNDQLKTKAGQFKSKEFANASMAMCALIAAADGTIDAYGLDPRPQVTHRYPLAHMV